VLALTSGERSIRMRPPLVISAAEAEEAIRRIDAGLVSAAG
jgi:acetylornithine/succinyldiaminopimelate/putrescine aminotransferase